MLSRLGVRARQLLDGFWLVPGLVLLAFALGALAAIELDRRAGEDGIEWAYGGDPEAARQTLGVIAGSLITVAGVTFSITIVTLQLVSSQYSPRALRSFLADRVNQLLAGTYIGIFVFCLLTLRVVREERDEVPAFVPSLAVTIAIVAGLVGFALILLFIHHMAQSIKVAHIVSRISDETMESLERLYPADYGRPDQADEQQVVSSWEQRAPSAIVRAADVGYVQSIALDDIADAAGAANVRVPIRVGDFVARENPLVILWDAERLDDDAPTAIRRAVSIGVERDHHQDLSFGLRQLADIALRALSPGVNDPTTALECIDYLRAVVARLASRAFPAPVRSVGAATIAVAQRTFRDHVEEAFLELGRFAGSNVRVTLALLEALEAVAAAAREAGAAERAAVVADVATAVAEPALEDARTARDREAVVDALARLAYAGTSL